MLSKEEIKSLINKWFTGTDDESLEDIEKILGTIDELYDTPTGEDLDDKLRELDEKWRKRYRDRFFRTDVKEQDEIKRDNVTDDNTSYDDLWEDDN